MTYDTADRRQQLLTVTDTLDRLSGLRAERAGEVAKLLWDDIAAIELGWQWHEIGPDGALREAQRLIADGRDGSGSRSPNARRGTA